MQPLPVWVIGGYLGAGKTTLLNAVLRDTQGVRTAVLVNDFGSVNVDAGLIAASGAQTIELTNGCTCCTIGGDLVLALKALLERTAPPERIVIEASGVADPRAVARLAGCVPALSQQGTIVVADCETIRARSEDKYVGGLVGRQLAGADAVVLSKADLVTEETLAGLHAWLRQRIPGVPVFEARDGGGVPASLLFDADAARGAHAPADVEPAHEDAPALFTSRTFRCAGTLDRTRFREAARGMIGSIARAKGTVTFSDEPRATYLFQLAGERWSLGALQPVTGAPQTQIVTIAVAAREADLERALRALRAAAQAAPDPGALLIGERR